MNNILVTGGAGYIGSHVVEKLEKTHSNIVIIDNLKNGFERLINKKAEFIKGDINNIKLIKKIINKIFFIKKHLFYQHDLLYLQFPLLPSYQ